MQQSTPPDSLHSVKDQSKALFPKKKKEKPTTTSS